MRIPDRVYTRPLLLRGALLWGVSRAFLAFGTWITLGVGSRFTLAVTVQAAAWIVIVVGLLGLLELRRRNEHLLLANLGIYQRTLGMLAAVPALLCEIAMALALPDGAARS
jgi:hypothetical protein